MNIQDLLGAVVQSGMSPSSSARIRNSLGGGGTLEGIAGMLGGAQGGGVGGLGGLGGMLGGGGGGALGGILSQAGRAVGGNQNLALGGLGALAGAVLGGGRRSVRGALGGGVMALLGAMAFQALQASAGRPARVPLGLAAPQNEAERAELERNCELVLKAMLNAAKADGEIDREEIRRIVGKVKETGAGSEAQEFLMAEMKKPMETESLVEAAKGRPELAAQIYSASLLAIEVDTPAEEKYLEQLASSLGLPVPVTGRIHEAVGLAR